LTNQPKRRLHIKCLILCRSADAEPTSERERRLWIGIGSKGRGSCWLLRLAKLRLLPGKLTLLLDQRFLLFDLQPLLPEKCLLFGQSLRSSPSLHEAFNQRAKAPPAPATRHLCGREGVAMGGVVKGRASRCRILRKRGDRPQRTNREG
jgi:hypothetical protein